VTDVTEACTLQKPIVSAGRGRPRRLNSAAFFVDALGSNPPQGPLGWVKLVDLLPN